MINENEDEEPIQNVIVAPTSLVFGMLGHVHTLQTFLGYVSDNADADGS